MRRYLYLIFLVPIAVILIAFSVANRHVVRLSFDPMSVETPALAVDLPLFVIIFAAIATGLVIGGIGTWFTQAKHRRLARERRREADKWRFEAEKQKTAEQQERFRSASGGQSAFPVLPPSEAA